MRYSTKKINRIANDTGVYQFVDKGGKVLYVGKANDLKKRISSYFTTKRLDRKTRILVKQIAIIKTLSLPTEFDALIYEANLIKKLKPKYNVALKDDKSYIYVTLTDEEFPRVLITRRKNESKLINTFGPFPSKRIVKDITSYLRRIFPYCTQNPLVKKVCFYSHLNLCSPCPGKIKQTKGVNSQQKKNKYLRNIKNIKNILSGKGTKVLKQLEKEMETKSSQLHYEEAALLRDKIIKLKYLYKWKNLSSAYLENDNIFEERFSKEGQDLQLLLKKYFDKLDKLVWIECYDVSNISGDLATGAMITFINGKPAKQYYRRFKIKRKKYRDDFSQLKEIFLRRLRHTDWTLPDLLVVDGGKPQLQVFSKVLEEVNLFLPFIGLSKRDEQIVIPEGENYLRIKLKKNSPALQLVQRLRDEAHRFAHKYHQLLRLKHLINNVEKKKKV